MYKINKKVLRYVVPFRFFCGFEEAVKRVDGATEIIHDGKIKKIWNRIKTGSSKSESDLYDYIKNEYKFDDDNGAVSQNKVGCGWYLYKSSGYENNKENGKVKEFLYFEEEIKEKAEELPKYVKITITKTELMLFRNGLGFVLYELEANNKINDSDELMRFQYNIRELNKGSERGQRLWEEKRWEEDSGEMPAFGIVTRKTNVGKIYLEPFSLGHWIANEVFRGLFLTESKKSEISYFAERKSAYTSMIERGKKCTANLKNEKLERKEDTEKVQPDYCEAKELKVPDKAILFSYVCYEEKNEEENGEINEKYSQIFHIANGYKASYKFSEQIIKDIKRPFAGVFWYATQEGAACAVWPETDNKDFFQNQFASRVENAYFPLYIKVLYQSFSLLIYSEKIQKRISAVDGTDFDGIKEFDNSDKDKLITNLYSEINLFLTKNMATSVSHIHHQSEFYVYLKRQLRIKEDTESVMAGLKAFEGYQRGKYEKDEEDRRLENEKQEKERRREREKQEERRNNLIQACTAFFAVSGVEVIFDTWKKLFEKQPSDDLQNWIKFIFALLAVGVAGWMFVKAVRSSFIHSKFFAFLKKHIKFRK